MSEHIEYDSAGYPHKVREASRTAEPAPTENTAKNNKNYELWQGGIVVASVSGPDPDAFAQIQHYALIYSQDGPCEIRESGKREKVR